MGEEIDLNALRKVARQAAPEIVSKTDSDAINTRERFLALPVNRQLEIALADGHDNVPSYLSENFSGMDPDINELRKQVKKIEEDKK
ncbi:MAG: hypothetical protein AAB734_00555 [Patescibacteria group bacterium]